MVATYFLDENELNESFFQQLKQQFMNKRISITVAEAIDETEYLMSSPANANRLLSSIENSKKENELQNIDLNAWKDKLGE